MAECAARLEITGILTKDLEIRVGKDGKSKYCYFTLRVDKPGYKDKNTGEYVKVDSDFFNMRANGYIPDKLLRMGAKEKMQITCSAKLLPRTKNTVKKEDGSVTVYENWTWDVIGGSLINVANPIYMSENNGGASSGAAVGNSDGAAPAQTIPSVSADDALPNQMPPSPPESELAAANADNNYANLDTETELPF